SSARLSRLWLVDDGRGMEVHPFAGNRFAIDDVTVVGTGLGRSPLYGIVVWPDGDGGTVEITSASIAAARFGIHVGDDEGLPHVGTTLRVRSSQVSGGLAALSVWADADGLDLGVAGDAGGNVFRSAGVAVEDDRPVGTGAPLRLAGSRLQDQDIAAGTRIVGPADARPLWLLRGAGNRIEF